MALVTQAEAARILGITPQAIGQAVSKGRFKIVMVNENKYQDATKIFADRKNDHQILNAALTLTEQEKDKKVIYEPVKLEQNYRNFDFNSPWEGTKYLKEFKESKKNEKN